MTETFGTSPRKIPLPVVALLVVLIVALGFLAYITFYQYNQIEDARSAIASSTQMLAETQDKLAQSQSESADLAQRLQDTENYASDLAEELGKAEDNVEILAKLQTIDPELLKKYSRVYFLNEHYRPNKLTLIDDDYWWPEDDDEFIDENVWPFLEELLEDAEDDDIDLRVVSAFRAFDRQRELKSSYDIIYGEGTANQFSAAQGYSEHQLGTTVDFTTKELGNNFTSIAQTEAYEWLKDNAYKYGFIMSYPENNEYYQFEPWHWRFVGKELADHLHDENLNFYDMDQREIDSYRLNIFED